MSIYISVDGRDCWRLIPFSQYDWRKESLNIVGKGYINNATKEIQKLLDAEYFWLKSDSCNIYKAKTKELKLSHSNVSPSTFEVTIEVTSSRR